VNAIALAFLLHMRNRFGGEGKEEKTMLEQANVTARLRATIEEELGTFRRFADVPSAELEEMAARIARVVAPYLGSRDEPVSHAA
jgi:hypothetical protein